MLDLIPRRAFFRFEIPIHHMPKLPRIDADLGKWHARYLAPPLIEIEGRPPLADIYWAWNDEYFIFAVDVPNRVGGLVCDPKEWWKGDGLRLCLDTRDTRENKRATRFCHFFYFMPIGGGKNGDQPVIGTHKMSRAKEPPPPVDVSRILIASRVQRRSYVLEAAIPSACLTGWEPSDHPRIGIFTKIRDTSLGDQHLTVDDELGWNADPSTWATAVLKREP